MKPKTKVQIESTKKSKTALPLDYLKYLAEKGRGKKILIRILKKNDKSHQASWSDWDQSWDRDD